MAASKIFIYLPLVSIFLSHSILCNFTVKTSQLNNNNKLIIWSYLLTEQNVKTRELRNTQKNYDLNEAKSQIISTGCVMSGFIYICLHLQQNLTITEVLCCPLPDFFNIFFRSCPFQYETATIQVSTLTNCFKCPLQ